MRVSREADGNSFHASRGMEEVWLTVLQSASGVTSAYISREAAGRSTTGAAKEPRQQLNTLQKVSLVLSLLPCWTSNRSLLRVCRTTLAQRFGWNKQVVPVFPHLKFGCVSPQMANTQRSWIVFAALAICLLACWNNFADAYPPKPESPGSNASPEDWAKYQAAVRHYVNLITRQRSAQRRVGKQLITPLYSEKEGSVYNV